MAWTAPMTAVANTPFTAAQFNTHVRDNLLETAPAKATAAGRFFVTTGPNAIAERSITGAKVSGGIQTTSTIATFGDLLTVGPTVTATTGTSAFVICTAQIENSTGGASGMMGYAVSGATTIAAGADRCLRLNSAVASVRNRASAVMFQTGLTPGSNTFTAKYTTHSGGTAGFDERELLIIAL